MANYYRITAYHKGKDISIIMDSYGFFEKKWQFSADLIRRGFDIIEVSDDTQFLDGDIERVKEPIPKKYILRAWATGKPQQGTKNIGDIDYKTASGGGRAYIPNI